MVHSLLEHTYNNNQWCKPLKKIPKVSILATAEAAEAIVVEKQRSRELKWKMDFEERVEVKKKAGREKEEALEWLQQFDINCNVLHLLVQVKMALLLCTR